MQIDLPDVLLRCQLGLLISLGETPNRELETNSIIATSLQASSPWLASHKSPEPLRRTFLTEIYPNGDVKKYQSCMQRNRVSLKGFISQVPFVSVR